MNIHAGHEGDGTLPPDGFVPNYLLYLLAAASAAVSAEFHEQVRARGLRVPEWRVLACLNDRDGQMVTQLAALALMEQSRLTRIIDQMAAKGLVRRRSDAADRRRVRVYLTPEGRQLAEELVVAAKTHEAGILDQLGADEARMLKDVLKRIHSLHRPGDEPAAAGTAQEPAGPPVG
jgi:DNA-binding MarR family transcriptional regulator